MAEKRSPWIPPQEIYEPLGRAAANFACLEVVVSRSIGKLLLGDHRVSRALDTLIERLGFAARIDALQRVFEEVESDNERLSEMRDLVRRLKEVNERRNELIHSLWLGADDSGGATRMRLRKGKRPAKCETILQSETVGSILDHAEECLDLGSDIIAFFGWVAPAKA